MTEAAVIYLTCSRNKGSNGAAALAVAYGVNLKIKHCRISVAALSYAKSVDDRIVEFKEFNACKNSRIPLGTYKFKDDRVIALLKGIACVYYASVRLTVSFTDKNVIQINVAGRINTAQAKTGIFSVKEAIVSRQCG